MLRMGPIMTVTPAQLHLATQYPYDPPHESFLFVNGRALPIVEPRDDPLVGAAVRLGSRLRRAEHALRELGVAATPGMAERTPLLSYGSNTSPFGIDRKYRPIYGDGSVVIPAIACELADHDVVYSPHFSRWGTIPATIAISPGAVAPLIALYLAPAQLQRMHDIECGATPERAGNYVAGRFTDVDLQLDGGQRLSAVPTYVSRHGILARNGQPVALTALRTRERRFGQMNGSELLAALLHEFAPRSSRDEFLARLIADTEFRHSCTARLVARALPVDVPSFVAELV